MSGLHRVRVAGIDKDSPEYGLTVEIDGEPVKGVQHVVVERDHEEYARLTLTMAADIEVDDRLVLDPQVRAIREGDQKLLDLIDSHAQEREELLELLRRIQWDGPDRACPACRKRFDADPEDPHDKGCPIWAAITKDRLP